jgi:hypothetical protein
VGGSLMRWRQLCPPRSTEILLLVALTACGDQRGEAPSAPSLDELQQVVIGNAAAGLDETGHFRLATSTSPKELTLPQARDLATAWITTSGPSFRRTLERDHGGDIDFAELRSCGQVVYAASAFKSLPSEVPLAVHRHYGSRWLVGFCGKSGGLQVSVSVSGLATDLTIVDGRIDYGRSDGNEFFALGVPREWDSPAGLSAERAVARMGHRTGRRVKEVPFLIAADPRTAYPQGAMWRIKLESPVRLHAKKSGRTVEDETLYAGLNEDVQTLPHRVVDDASILRVPTAAQPPDQVIQYLYYPADVKQTPESRPSMGSVRLSRVPEMPITFEPATVGEN